MTGGAVASWLPRVGTGRGDPDFENTRIMGTVFQDRNGDGVQDEGEAGLPGVRLITATGLVIDTDAYGRYHIEGIDVGADSRGHNFIVKVDESTLAGGSFLTTQNPQSRRMTLGLLAQFNFGVKQPDLRFSPSEVKKLSHTPMVAPSVAPDPVVQQAPVYSFDVDGLFALNKYELKDIAEPGLSNLAHFTERLRKDFQSIEHITLKAHTDRLGSVAHNAVLSAKRAGTVKAYLVRAGVNADVVQTTAVGSGEPVVNCPGPRSAKVIACLAPNRHFEIQVRGIARSGGATLVLSKAIQAQ